MTSLRDVRKSESWLHYRSSFENFSRKVRDLQSLNAQPNLDPAGVEAALLEVERARLSYNGYRDAWARELLRRTARYIPGARRDPAASDPARVKAVAELLWDLTGRPEGSADDNWHRAENIVRRAASYAPCCS